eukprot:1938025-Prymnesium_polylepis.1
MSLRAPCAAAHARRARKNVPLPPRFGYASALNCPVASKVYHEGEVRSEKPHDRPNRPAVCGGRRRGASYRYTPFALF